MTAGEQSLGNDQFSQDAEDQQRIASSAQDRVRFTHRTVDRDLATGDIIIEEASSELPAEQAGINMEQRVRIADEEEVVTEHVPRSQPPRVADLRDDSVTGNI
jgi:hypothetical protein